MSESLRAATSGGERRALDFYPTPLPAVRALIPHIKNFSGPVWEPAAGTGHIANVLRKEAHRQVIATDITARDGFKLFAEMDFLTTCQPRGGSIVTNPPFDLAQEFIEHARFLGVSQVALLLKSTFWHAKRRAQLFRTWPPSTIYALTWRLDFTGAGRPHRDCIWCVWEPGNTGTRFELLDRPD